MEETLRAQLLDLGARFEAASGLSLTSIGKKALNDDTVFGRLQDRALTFHIRTYDRLLIWMDAHWPNKAEWPVDVPRPSASAEAAP